MNCGFYSLRGGCSHVLYSLCGLATLLTVSVLLLVSARISDTNS